MNRIDVSAHTQADTQAHAQANARANRNGSANTRATAHISRPRAVVRRNTAVVMAAALGVCAACVFATGPSRAADNAKAAPRPAMTVTTARPAASSLPIRLAANGNIAAWQEAVIGSEANGLRLTDVLVNVGDVVKAGQVLATFSADTVRAELAQGRASVLEAEANAADAKANADRARSLQATGALSAQQINQYATTEQTARAKVAAARAVLQAQQLRVNQTQVRAPDSGVISSRTATVGSVVGAGTELFKLVRKGRLEWRAEVTATELARIQPGTPVTVVAASGATLQGTVRNVAPTVDPLTRSALVYVDLPNATPTLQKSPEITAPTASVEAPGPAAGPPQGNASPLGRQRGHAVPNVGILRMSSSLSMEASATNPAHAVPKVGAPGPAAGPPQGRPAPSGGSAAHEVASVGAPPVLPGMFARGEFGLGSSQALTLPQQSLVVRDGFTYVFLVGADQRVTQRKVDVGRRMGEQVEILSGVEPQATVAVRGAGFLNEGDTVRVANEAATSPAASPAAASATSPAVPPASLPAGTAR